MYKLFFSSLIFIITIFSKIVFAQENSSIQINGGFIYPINSSNGLTGNIQFIYPINNMTSLYIYAGYSAWDKHFVRFPYVTVTPKNRHSFESYSEDKHLLIPIYIGSKINLHTNKFFTSFVSFEAGYSHLSYNSYGHLKSTDPETGEVLGYYADQRTRANIQEDLFGIGIGAGISHPMGDNLSFELSFKLNSNINSNYYGFLSSKGTYTMFLAGFNFGI